MNEHIEVYTDGACSGNPGKGGWAAILLYKGHRKNLVGGYRKTTNNRMELMAVIEALQAIKNKDIPVIVYSDSQYVVDSINKGYIHQWIKKGFNKVKNPDLWKKLIALIQQFKNIQFQWVKGHHTNLYNKECDAMAVNAYLSDEKGTTLKVDEYYEQLGNEESSENTPNSLF
ncbi:MAG: ribonuclease HI [Bacteroidia bacterium]